MLLHHKSVFNYGQPTQKDRAELGKTQIRATRMTEIYGEPLHEEELYSEFSAQKWEKIKEKERKAYNTMNISTHIYYREILLFMSGISHTKLQSALVPFS